MTPYAFCRWWRRLLRRPGPVRFCFSVFALTSNSSLFPVTRALTNKAPILTHARNSQMPEGMTAKGDCPYLNMQLYMVANASYSDQTQCDFAS